MSRKSDHIKAEVKSSSDSCKRTYLITLTAPINTFEFTDLLVDRKVIGSLDIQLKKAVKDIVTVPQLQPRVIRNFRLLG